MSSFHWKTGKHRQSLRVCRVKPMVLWHGIVALTCKHRCHLNLLPGTVIPSSKTAESRYETSACQAPKQAMIWCGWKSRWNWFYKTSFCLNPCNFKIPYLRSKLLLPALPKPPLLDNTGPAKHTLASPTLHCRETLAGIAAHPGQCANGRTCDASYGLPAPPALEHLEQHHFSLTRVNALLPTPVPFL